MDTESGLDILAFGFEVNVTEISLSGSVFSLPSVSNTAQTKGKVFLVLNEFKHYAMKAYGRVDI
jgi:hypothetical protein